MDGQVTNWTSAKIINDIFRMLRLDPSMQDVIAYACEALATGLNASRCVVWKVVGDQLEATNEFSTDGETLFLSNALDSQESMGLVLEFLSRFSDESGSGVIAVSDISQDRSMHEDYPRLASLLELADVRSRLLGQLRSRGIFSGFIDIQKCAEAAEWSASECLQFEEVTVALSVLVQQSFDFSHVCRDLDELRLKNDISGIFSDTKDVKIAWKSACSLLASHMGFEQAQIYLNPPDDSGILA